MPRKMCPKRQQLENELTSAHRHKASFESLIGARQDLEPTEQADRQRVYSEYNSAVAAVNEHDSEAASSKCGCQ